MAINTSNNKVRIISTTVSGLSANSKFSDIKSPALVVNTSDGGIFYADGAGGTSLKQLAALPSHTHSGYATTTQLGSYLPKTGGQLATTSSTILSLNNTNSTNNEVGLRLDMNSSSKGWVGYTSNTGTYLYTYTGPHKLGIKEDGTGFIDGNTIIHSGNIGSQSVESANTLKYVAVNDLTNVTQCTFFKGTLNAANMPSTASNYITGITLATDANPHYRLILGLDQFGKVFTRAEQGGGWQGWHQLARTSDIPSSLSSFTNDSGYITNSPSSLEIMGNDVAFIDFHYAKSSGDFDARIACHANNQLRFYGHLLPSTSTVANAESIGASNRRFNTIYAQTGNFSGGVTATGGFTGNVTGNVSGSSGSCTGNAATATTATTAQQLSGFTKRANANATWGTLTSTNGYTPVYWVDTAAAGGIGISDKNQQTYVQIDGYFYQNEGQYQVLDTNTGATKSHSHAIGDLPTHTFSSAQALGWTSTIGTTKIPTINTIAYWNGAHSGTSSNLQYCDRGRFGTIVTKNAGDYATSGHTHSGLVGDIISFTKSLNVTTSWQDTGISGADLSYGTYIIQLYANLAGTASIWDETFSGIMTWYAGSTNSTDADEIILHKAGHASNGQSLFLRTTRQSGSSTLKLQIACTINFNAAKNLTFKFRKMI